MRGEYVCPPLEKILRAPMGADTGIIGYSQPSDDLVTIANLEVDCRYLPSGPWLSKLLPQSITAHWPVVNYAFG